ncbi:MAG: hypothetical protein HYY38_09795 [Rhodospirillales bacterium]|nr:hypothetical protein [Rhodospirillales bacterium]
MTLRSGSSASAGTWTMARPGVAAEAAAGWLMIGSARIDRLITVNATISAVSGYWLSIAGRCSTNVAVACRCAR